MTDITSDPNDPRLKRYPSAKEDEGMNEAYLVLPEEARSQKDAYIRPLRFSYIHITCNTETRMSREIAETYARNPKFYGATFCVKCNKHFPVNEFTWADSKGEMIGT